MSTTWYPVPTEQPPQAQELCSCPALNSLWWDQDLASEEQGQRNEAVPVASTLSITLRAALLSHFPRSTPFSILLFHITRFEHIQMPPASPIVHKRLHCHASAGFLEQVVQNIRRTLRTSDQILVDEQGTGAALLFPQVDQLGISCIAERVSHSINLLQAETVIPPLRHETEIVFGSSSYPNPASSLEELLARADRVQEKIVFRPAVLPEPAHPRAARVSSAAKNARAKEARQHPSRVHGIPFMQIPSRLPTRLKQLVPYALALDLRCAPVGRDHNRLTVAMANPADARAIRYLSEATGMTIFPVSCEPSALETLLASGW